MNFLMDIQVYTFLRKLFKLIISKERSKKYGIKKLKTSRVESSDLPENKGSKNTTASAIFTRVSIRNNENAFNFPLFSLNRIMV